MNDVIKELFERKSVRVYSDEMIEEDKKQLIIDAAIQAPTAGNMTLYSIIDVEDQEIKENVRSGQAFPHRKSAANTALFVI